MPFYEHACQRCGGGTEVITGESVAAGICPACNDLAEANELIAELSEQLRCAILNGKAVTHAADTHKTEEKRLRAENERLRGALNRIANYARKHGEPYDEKLLVGGWPALEGVARRALAGDKLEEDVTDDMRSLLLEAEQQVTQTGTWDSELRAFVREALDRAYSPNIYSKTEVCEMALRDIVNGTCQWQEARDIAQHALCALATDTPEGE